MISLLLYKQLLIVYISNLPILSYRVEGNLLLVKLDFNQHDQHIAADSHAGSNVSRASRGTVQATEQAEPAEPPQDIHRIYHAKSEGSNNHVLNQSFVPHSFVASVASKQAESIELVQSVLQSLYVFVSGKSEQIEQIENTMDIPEQLGDYERLNFIGSVSKK